MAWNGRGTGLLVSAQTEVDTTGQSYYGETNLYYMSVKDASSIIVQLDKKGPIYDFDWAPNGREFTVTYGFMPAKVGLFDLNTDRVHDFGSGPRSVARFSPTGSILMIGGFGNLRGEVEMWARDGLRLLNKFDAPDSTMFAWAPDSRHLLTATTAPRLKVDNGYKIWHYTRGLVREVGSKELWDVCWQPGDYPTRPISPVSAQAKAAVKPAAKQVYRPPGAKGRAGTVKLHEDEKPHQQEEKKLSKAALKNKKKREAKARAAAAAAGGVISHQKTAEQKQGIAATRALLKEPSSSTQDLEKRIRNTRKKARAIDQLKSRRDAGEELQANQLSKIENEGDVITELARLEQQLASLKA
eukprot:UC1_evm1s338